MTKDYIRKVHYHETDKMGITHHANYIRYMEEARVDYLEQVGYGYARLELEGIISPVIGVECRYLQSTTFDDEIRIQVRVEEFKGVRLTIGYTMLNQRTGQSVLTGRTMHCFTDRNGKPIILKKLCPGLDALLREAAAEQSPG